MPSWYDIAGLESRDQETCEGLDESRAAVEALLAEQWKAHPNLTPATTVVAGFSQVLS